MSHDLLCSWHCLPVERWKTRTCERLFSLAAASNFSSNWSASTRWAVSLSVTNTIICLSVLCSFVYRWSTTLPGFSWCLASRATWQWSSGYLPSSPQSTFLPLSWVAVAIFSLRKVKTFPSPGMALIDRLGRRVLCLCSYLGILGALLVIGAGFQLSEYVNSWVWVANF